MSELNTQFDASVSLQEIVVTSTAELNAALNTMQSTGGVIKLASGLDTYQIELINMGGAGRPITIEPVDLNDPPVVSDILISNSEYITLNGLIVEARDDEIGLNGGDAGNVDIYGSSFITLSNSVISGNAGGMWTVENGPAVTGGRAVDSDNITITGTTFENLGHGFRFSNVTNFYFTENELTGLQGDGLGGSGLQDATISGNYMHDFWGSTQDVNHSDMIQIFGSTTAIPTQNVIIENNIFDSGNGAATETIFIRNEQFGLSDSENATFHENIQINNNVIHNGHGHGIAVNDVDGLQIHQNTVLWNQASGMVSNLGGDSVSAVPSIKAGNSVNVSMQENVSFRTTVEGVEQSGNYAITYTDAGAENYAYSHFVNLSGMGDTDFRDLMLRAESTLSGEFGASLTTNINPYLPDMGNLAVLSYDNKPGDNLGFQFSADYSVIKGADIEETNVTVTWLFSDGHVAEGLHAVHTFESAGQYQVQLMLRDANGEELYLTREIDVNQYEHLKLDFSENIIDTSGYNSEFTVEGEGYTSGRDGEGAFHVNESNSISFSQVNTHLENFETLQINVGVKLDTVGEAGYILHHHKAYRLFAYDDGSLFFSIETNEGYFELRTDAAVIADNDWHDISIQYDGPANSLKLLVDSAEVASGEASGITNFDPSYTLVIGHPWGDAASVTIDELEIMSPKSIVAKNIEDTSQPVIQGTTDDVLNPIFLEEAESTQQPSVSPAVVPADEEASVSDVNVSVTLDFDNGVKDISTNASELIVVGNGSAEGRDGNAAFHIDDDSSIRFSLTNEHLSNLDTLQINVGVKLDDVGTEGYILHHHKAYRLFAYDDGSLFFSIETNEGYFELRTDAAVIADNDWHDISIQYDGPANSLRLLVDSAEVASGEASGTTNFDPSHGLIVGHPWGSAASATIDTLEISSSNPIFLEEAESTQQPSVSPAVVPADEEASVSDVNVSVTLDFDNGVKDISTNASELIVVGNGSAEGRDGNAAFHIDDDSSIRFSLTNEHLSNLDTLQINVGVKLDDVGTEGYILHHHKAYRLFAYDDGSLFFSIETNEGYFELRTDAAVIADNDWHDISIQYDGPANSLRLLVDSAEVASGEASGTTNFDPSHGLIVGHPWGSAASATIDTLEISSPPATENLTGSYLYSFFDIDPEQLVNTMEIETNYTNEALEVDDYINTPGDWDFMS